MANAKEKNKESMKEDIGIGDLMRKLKCAVGMHHSLPPSLHQHSCVGRAATNSLPRRRRARGLSLTAHAEAAKMSDETNLGRMGSPVPKASLPSHSGEDKSALGAACERKMNPARVDERGRR